MVGQLNYQNNYVSVNLVEQSILLHFLNERLRVYSSATYTVTSRLPGFTQT